MELISIIRTFYVSTISVIQHKWMRYITKSSMYRVVPFLWTVFIILILSSTSYAQECDYNHPLNQQIRQTSIQIDAACKHPRELLLEMFEIETQMDEAQLDLAKISTEVKNFDQNFLNSVPLVKAGRAVRSIRQRAEDADLIWLGPIGRNSNDLIPIKRLVLDRERANLLRKLTQEVQSQFLHWDEAYNRFNHDKSYGWDQYFRIFNQEYDSYSQNWGRIRDNYKSWFVEYGNLSSQYARSRKDENYKHCFAMGEPPYSPIDLTDHKEYLGETEFPSDSWPNTVKFGEKIEKRFTPDDGWVWKVDGFEYSRQLRESAKAKADVYKQHFDIYYSGSVSGYAYRTGLAVSATGSLIKDGAVFIGEIAAGLVKYSYYDSPKALLEGVGLIQSDEPPPSPQELTYLEIAAQLLLDMGKFFVDAKKGAVGDGASAFYDAYGMGESEPDYTPEQNLRAYQFYEQAASKGKQGLGQTTALTSLAAELSLVILGASGLEPLDLAIKAANKTGASAASVRAAQEISANLKIPEVKKIVTEQLNKTITLTKEQLITVAERTKTLKTITRINNAVKIDVLELVKSIERTSSKKFDDIDNVSPTVRKQLDNAIDEEIEIVELELVDNGTLIEVSANNILRNSKNKAVHDTKDIFDIPSNRKGGYTDKGDPLVKSGAANSYVRTNKNTEYYKEIFNVDDVNNTGVRFRSEPSVDYDPKLDPDAIPYLITKGAFDKNSPVKLTEIRSTKYRICPQGAKVDCLIFDSLEEAKRTGYPVQRLDLVEDIREQGSKIAKIVDTGDGIEKAQFRNPKHIAAYQAGIKKLNSEGFIHFDIKVPNIGFDDSGILTIVDPGGLVKVTNDLPGMSRSETASLIQEAFLNNKGGTSMNDRALYILERTALPVKPLPTNPVDFISKYVDGGISYSDGSVYVGIPTTKTLRKYGKKSAGSKS